VSTPVSQDYCKLKSDNIIDRINDVENDNQKALNEVKEEIVKLRSEIKDLNLSDRKEEKEYREGVQRKNNFKQAESREKNRDYRLFVLGALTAVISGLLTHFLG